MFRQQRMLNAYFFPTPRWSAVIGVAACAVATRIPVPTLSFVAAVVLVAGLPGFFLAHLLGIARACGRGPSLVAGLALSLSTVPVLLDGLWQWVHDPLTLLLIWCALLFGLIGAWRPAPGASTISVPPLFEERRSAVFFWGVLAWLSVALVLAHWPAEWRGMMLPAAPRDFIKHHAVLFSLDRACLPLRSVYYADPGGGPYYYYHFFYLLPATARLLGGNTVSIEAAFAVFAVLVAAAVLGLAYILARALFERRTAGLFTVLCASLVGGLDLLPDLYNLLRSHQLVIVLDAWAPVEWRVHNFATLMLWCPQHMLGLVVLLVAVWLLSFRPRAVWWIALGPMLSASLFGTSIYLALTVFPAAVLWAAIQLLRLPREQRRRWLAGLAIVVLLGLVLMSSQARHYAEMSRRHDGGLTASWGRYSYAMLGRLLPPGVLANLVDAPWIFFLEYGVRFVALLVVPSALWRGLWRDAGGLLLLLASGLGAILFLTFHSSIHPFDYSFKIGLFPSMALTAILAGALFQPFRDARRWWNPFGWRLADLRWPRWRRPLGALIGLCIVLGVPVGMYEIPMMALRRFVVPSPLREDSAAIRFVRAQLPREAVIQVEPVADARRSRMNAVPLLDRQLGAMSPDDAEVNVFRPRHVANLWAAVHCIQAAGATASAAEAAAGFRAAGVTHVFVGTVERERWASLSKFDDSEYFERLFDSPGARVYRIK
jgi:hypothetical protein